MADRPAGSSSPWVAQMLRLGMVPLAKTTLPEFGLTATTESLRNGATRNPWDLTRSAGGSSGGSAALVAAGVVPIAHANDGGGSIRIPAACCGLVGLKPSRGRLVDRPELERCRCGSPFRVCSPAASGTPPLPRCGRAGAPRPMAAGGRTRHRTRPAAAARRCRDGRHPRAAGVGPDRRGCPRRGPAVRAGGSPRRGDVATGRGPVRHRLPALLGVRRVQLQYGGAAVFGRPFDGRATEPFMAASRAVRPQPGAAGPGGTAAAPAGPRARARLDRYDVLLAPVVGHETPPIGHLGPEVPSAPTCCGSAVHLVHAAAERHG